MKFKKGMFGSALVGLSALLAGCNAKISGGNLPSGAFMNGPFDNVWNKLLWLGTLGFLGHTLESPMVGFMRLLVLILVFAVFYELAGLINLQGGVRGTIAAVLAIMTAVFMPGTILAGLGTTYATLVSFILIGVPVAIGFFILYRIPANNWLGHLARIVVIVLLIVMLYQIRGHALELLNAPPASFGSI